MLPEPARRFAGGFGGGKAQKNRPVRSRAWRERGGCPAYQGLLNAGSRAAVQCGLVSIPLHDYVGVKFCESGRRIYCPIWNEKGAAENQVADTPPEEGET